MKKLIKLIMVALMMMLVLTPTTKVEAKKKSSKTVTVTIKKNSDIAGAVKKLHNNAMKKKATNIKVKGNLNKSRKIIKEMESQIQQYNGNGVVLLIDATKKPKTSKGYTTYKVTKNCDKCYIYWNKVVDKMEQEAKDWVQTSNTEQDTGATNESANAVLSIINQATNNETSKPIKYAIGTGQKTFAQLTDYEKVQFIHEHDVFSASRSPKNHVGMYYSNNIVNSGSFLEGKAYGVCVQFASIEQALFTNLGICAVKVTDTSLDHVWTEIYMQSAETGEYRWYLFDYKLYASANAKSSTGATIKHNEVDCSNYMCQLGKKDVQWYETYFGTSTIIKRISNIH